MPTRRQRRMAADYRDRGLSLRAVAARHGCGTGAVRRALAACGVAPRGVGARSPASRAERDERVVRDWLANRGSVWATARRCGVWWGSAAAALTRAGLMP